jgi:hypothetical protein
LTNAVNILEDVIGANIFQGNESDAKSPRMIEIRGSKR